MIYFGFNNFCLVGDKTEFYWIKVGYKIFWSIVPVSKCDITRRLPELTFYFGCWFRDILGSYVTSERKRSKFILKYQFLTEMIIKSVRDTNKKRIVISQSKQWNYLYVEAFSIVEFNIFVLYKHLQLKNKLYEHFLLVSLFHQNWNILHKYKFIKVMDR